MIKGEEQAVLCCRDAESAGVAHLLDFHQGACGQWEPRQRPDVVVTNPPWGNRLMANEGESYSVSQLEATWTELGLFLKVLPGQRALFRSRCKFLLGSAALLPERGMRNILEACAVSQSVSLAGQLNRFLSLKPGSRVSWAWSAVQGPEDCMLCAGALPQV